MSPPPPQVFHRRTLAFLMTHIGTFKIDLSTVYNQPGISTSHTAVFWSKYCSNSLTSVLSACPDHRFYQKWAPLTDPADTRSGIKGYVKASLSMLMKGEALNISLPPSSSSGASEDIEKSVTTHWEYYNGSSTLYLTNDDGYDSADATWFWNSCVLLAGTCCFLVGCPLSVRGLDFVSGSTRPRVCPPWSQGCWLRCQRPLNGQSSLIPTYKWPLLDNRYSDV